LPFNSISSFAFLQYSLILFAALLMLTFSNEAIKDAKVSSILPTGVNVT